MHAGGQRFDPARLHQLFYTLSYFYYGGLAQLARASGSYPGGRGFDPLGRHPKEGPLAQLVRADGS